MKTRIARIIPITALAIVLISMSPLAMASTLTMNLNPKTGAAKVDAVSTTKIVLTYPSNSTLSRYLRNVSSSLSLSGEFAGNTQGVQELQGSFDEWNDHVSVSNMSVSIDYSAKGNSTALVIDKTARINATVSGVFHVENGTVVADLGWRAFLIRGALNLPLGGQTTDVNLAGSAMEDSLASHEYASTWLMGAFGGGAFWDRPTLNFSALNTPLSTWTKNYDSATNTTTFSKTISGQDTFSVSADLNGQKYSLSAVSDPSGVVSVQGYADASGNSLVMASEPASTSTTLLAVVLVAGLAAVTAGYLAIRSRTRARTAAQVTASFHP